MDIGSEALLASSGLTEDQDREWAGGRSLEQASKSTEAPTPAGQRAGSVAAAGRAGFIDDRQSIAEAYHALRGKRRVRGDAEAAYPRPIAAAEVVQVRDVESDSDRRMSAGDGRMRDTEMTTCFGMPVGVEWWNERWLASECEIVRELDRLACELARKDKVQPCSRRSSHRFRLVRLRGGTLELPIRHDRRQYRTFEGNRASAPREWLAWRSSPSGSSVSD